MQKPSIGCIVHVHWCGDIVPAIITKVHGDTPNAEIDATIFGGLVPGTASAIAAAQTGRNLGYCGLGSGITVHEESHGWWDWPPRV